MHISHISDFEHWRTIARQLRLANLSPNQVTWDTGGQQSLFDSAGEDAEQQLAQLAISPPRRANATFRVPPDFIELAREVSYHRDRKKWEWLYNALWRLTTDQPHLLELTTDDVVHRLNTMAKAVRRDAHKMKAFVRFRSVVSPEEGEQFIAWHRPDHLVVRKVAPFFSRRFKGMRWTIMTPDESVSWNLNELTYGPGVPRTAAPQHDELEEVWKTYYANIFNPARIKIKMMKSEMPTRHWPTLPEAQLIEKLLAEAPERVSRMIAQTEGFASTAAEFFPSGHDVFDLNALRAAAQVCRGCDLHEAATQTVFGQGPTDARLVLVGEQPGDQEDLAGEPFIGPAGQLLDEALAQAGIARSELYVTNVVKHFKYEPRGKQRLHKKPNSREIRACRPWFQAEWSALRALPEGERVLVCLGATAAQALISPEFRIQSQRGQWHESSYSTRTLATWHPSSILRLPNETLKAQRFAELVSDLKQACGQ